MEAVKKKEEKIFTMKIKSRIHEWIIRKKLKWAIRLLLSIDISLRRKWSRQRRKRFWLEFSKSPSLQNEIFNNLLSKNP